MAVLFGLELETSPENSCMARGYLFWIFPSLDSSCTV